MVYNCTMSRTQIYLGAEELELLERAADSTGASRSELIRRAIRSTYGQPSRSDKLAALRSSAGSWRSSQQSGSEYVTGIRQGDLAARLRELGLE